MAWSDADRKEAEGITLIRCKTGVTEDTVNKNVSHLNTRTIQSEAIYCREPLRRELFINVRMMENPLSKV